jgi:hypothetical protein
MCCRVPRNITHLFGNPAILTLRTRGFASPDCSGFALSENYADRDQSNGQIVKIHSSLKIDKAPISCRRWALLNSLYCRAPRNVSHLFGNPAILILRTRGFASPDCSGFALSEILARSLQNGKNYVSIPAQTVPTLI